ncbi:MAG: substrate-binding domain-containing protein [Aggregatilineales bacterium]
MTTAKPIEKPPQPQRQAVPVVRITQDDNAPPVKVIVVEQESKRERSLGVFAVVLFLSSFFGALIPTVADLGSAVDTVERVLETFNPPPVVCVAGSNTILGEGIAMAADWEAAFENRALVDVIVQGVGSVRGVELAAEGGCVHVLAMSEPINDEQYLRLINAGVNIACAAEIGYDVIAFVSDINNPISTVRYHDLQRILNGRIRNWSQIGGPDQPLYVLARPGSGTTEYVLNKVALWRDPDPSDDLYFPEGADNYIPCRNNSACIDMTLSTIGSLYWVSTAWMRTQPQQYLRVIPILRDDEQSENPLSEGFDPNNYPPNLIRPLYMYVLNRPDIQLETYALAKEFMNYVRSMEGQRIMEEHHFYPHFRQPREVNVPLPPGFQSPPVLGPRAICR